MFVYIRCLYLAYSFWELYAARNKQKLQNYPLPRIDF